MREKLAMRIAIPALQCRSRYYRYYWYRYCTCKVPPPGKPSRRPAGRYTRPEYNHTSLWWTHPWEWVIYQLSKPVHNSNNFHLKDASATGWCQQILHWPGLGGITTLKSGFCTDVFVFNKQRQKKAALFSALINIRKQCYKNKQNQKQRASITSAT